MPDATALTQYYRTLTDQELLNLKREGGFTAEAEEVLAGELTRRNLTPGDLKRYVAVTQRNKLREEVTERGGGYRSLGLQFFGGRYLNDADRSADIQIRTKWFTISGIPLVPIASYRFKCMSHSGKWSSTSTQRGVIDRVSLDWAQVFMTWIKTAVLIVGVGLLIVVISWFLNGGRH
jgi:hypothetical protein